MSPGIVQRNSGTSRRKLWHSGGRWCLMGLKQWRGALTDIVMYRQLGNWCEPVNASDTRINRRRTIETDEIWWRLEKAKVLWEWSLLLHRKEVWLFRCISLCPQRIWIVEARTYHGLEGRLRYIMEQGRGQWSVHFGTQHAEGKLAMKRTLGGEQKLIRCPVCGHVLKDNLYIFMFCSILGIHFESARSVKLAFSARW